MEQRAFRRTQRHESPAPLTPVYDSLLLEVNQRLSDRSLAYAKLRRKVHFARKHGAGRIGAVNNTLNYRIGNNAI
jgi:hypothetical protein